MGIWEGIMLLCFGASWPMAIIKTVRAKNPKGKSFLFMGLIIIGYLSGIIGKFTGAGLAAVRNWVFWLYVLNTLMVAADFLLCLHYRRKNERA